MWKMSTKKENKWTLDQLHVAELRNYNKSCTLLLLRFTKEDDKNTKGEDYREGPHSNPTSAAEQSERISHNFWFPKAIMVNEDILETYQVYFPMVCLPSTFDYPVMRSEFFSEDWLECQQSARHAIFNAKLYHFIKFRASCCTWWKTLSYYLSNTTNLVSFGLPNKDLWPI